jgi:hypothetical protein
MTPTSGWQTERGGTPPPIAPTKGWSVRSVRDVLRSRRTLAVTTVAWLAGVVLRNAFYFEVLDRFGWLTGPVIALPLAAQGFAIVLMAVAQARQPHTRRVAVTVLLLVCVVGFLTTFSYFSMEIGVNARLLRCERLYTEAIVGLAESATMRGLASCGGIPQLDTGPPQRVVVPWSRVGNEWSGIVHDPTGTIDMLPHRGSRREPGAVVLFGSTLRGSFHVRGPWYFCWFIRDDGNEGATL